MQGQILSLGWNYILYFMCQVSLKFLVLCVIFNNCALASQFFFLERQRERACVQQSQMYKYKKIMLIKLFIINYRSLY